MMGGQPKAEITPVILKYAVGKEKLSIPIKEGS